MAADYDSQLIESVAVRRNRLMTALLYGTNPLQRRWTEGVRIFFFSVAVAALIAAVCVGYSFVSNLLADQTAKQQQQEQEQQQQKQRQQEQQKQQDQRQREQEQERAAQKKKQQQEQQLQRQKEQQQQKSQQKKPSPTKSASAFDRRASDAGREQDVAGHDTGTVVLMPAPTFPPVPAPALDEAA